MTIERIHHPVPGGRIFFSFLLLWFVSAERLRSASEEGIDVRPAAQARFEAKPGTVLSSGVRVTNTSPQKHTYDVRVVLPFSWRTITRETPYELEPGQSDTRLLSFSIPAETPAGQYEVRYVVHDDAAPPHQAEAVLTVVILPVLDLNLRLVEAPRFVVAGEKYIIHFLLLNKGNTTQAVRLRTRSGEELPIEIDSTVVRLGARESRSIEVRVITNAEIQNVLHHAVELIARSSEDSTVEARASSSVDVVPRISTVEERYHELPIQMKLIGVAEADRTGRQLEVSGYGSLTEERKDKLEFLFRGPETLTRSVLGQRDEYRLKYLSKDFEFYAGDWNYSLSPLTEYGRYSFGSGAKAQLGEFSLGGFYNETRLFSPGQKEAAAFVTYRFREASELGLNYLKKKERVESDLVSLRSVVRPFANTTLDLEYGMSSVEGLQENAVSARLTGIRPWINYDLRFVQSGPTYPGYYKDVNFRSGTVNLRPWRDVQIEGILRDEERNIRRDTTLRNAPRDRFYQLGAMYLNYIGLYYRITLQEDLMPAASYKRQEDVVQMRLGYNFSDLSLLANIDFGTMVDRLHDNARSPSERYALYAGIRPTVTQNYNVSLEYTKEQSIFTDEFQQREFQERLTASLTAWLFLGQRAQFQVSYFGSRTLSPVEQSFGLLDLSLVYVFPFNHTVTLRGRQNVSSASASETPTAYSLEYTIPVGIPLKRITSSGRLRGKVLDEFGKGVPNVLISVGDAAAVSDGEGNFLFASLRQDRFFLHVDKATMGLDHITMQQMPMEVTIRGGEEARLDIEVLRSSKLSGEVAVYDFEKRDHLDTTAAQVVESQKLSGIVLELTNGTEVHRRVTDNRGRFLFADLRSGRWTLKVSGGEIPSLHYYERESYELNLAGGSKKEVEFKVLPRKRTIKILQEGNLLEVKPAAPQAKPIVVPPRQQPIVEPQCFIFLSPARTGFVLQISSWLTKAKATQQAKEAEKKTGYKSTLQKAFSQSMGTRYRVQLGEFKTREEAEVACRKLQP